MSSTTTDGDSKLPPNDDQKTTGKATKRRPRRGLRTLERFDKASPYGVEWRVAGARKTEWFAEAADRDRRAAALEKERRANTLAILPVRSELQEWREFKDAIGDTPWRNVVEAWKRSGGAPKSLKVSDAVERYLRSQDERLAEGKIAKVSHRKNCPKAKAFLADLGHLELSAVTPEQIEEWIDDLGFEAAETFNTYRKVINAIFETCKKECSFNPASEIELRNDGGDVGLLSVEDTEKLLAYALKHYAEIVPRLALECFAGLRYSSAHRIERSDINFVDRGILLPAKKLKTGRRHYIDGLPDNLFDWLKLETPATWALTERQYMRLKSACFEDGKIPHPHQLPPARLLHVPRGGIQEPRPDGHDSVSPESGVVVVDLQRPRYAT